MSKIDEFDIKEVAKLISQKGTISFSKIKEEMYSLDDDGIKRILAYLKVLSVIDEMSVREYKFNNEMKSDYEETIDLMLEDYPIYGETINKIVVEIEQKYNALRHEITDFIAKNSGSKYSTKDIIGFLGKENTTEEYIKSVADELHYEGKLGRDGNHRYFVEEEKKDVKAELNKFKDLLDSGLISQEDYDNKKNELLGL